MKTFRLNNFSVLFLIALVLLALLSPILANEKAILLIQNRTIYFPAFGDSEIAVEKDAFQLKAPVPYSPQTIDYKNMSAVGPFEQQNVSSIKYRHWLGTDELGRDLLAGLIHGSQTAILIGMGSMFLAFFIALILGGLAGYYAHRGPDIAANKFIALSLSSMLYLLYLLFVFPWQSNHLTLILSFLLISVIYFLLFKLLCLLLSPLKRKKIAMPIDAAILRLIEIVDSLPVLFLIIALTAVFNQSKASLIAIIALVAWTGMAKHMRAQVLKVRGFQFIESGHALGFSNTHLLFRHLIPNALGPVFISLAFGVSSAILFESTLSFLGLGLGADQVSWGSILASARADYSAWWLAVFPGFLLFLTLLNLNKLGDQLSD